MTGLEVAVVAVLGTLAGLDLVSWPQAQLSRPLVAGMVGGLAVGAPLEGLGVGALLELFALDTLPVGAARYPDWGPGAVAAGALVGSWREAETPWVGLLAVVTVASASAWAGGWLMHAVRRANVVALHARVAALDAGDASALAHLQVGGLARDGARGLVLTAFTLLAGAAASSLFASGWHAPPLLAQAALAAVSGAVALAAAWRLFAHGRTAWFLGGGLAVGIVAKLLWT